MIILFTFISLLGGLAYGIFGFHTTTDQKVKVRHGCPLYGK